MRVPLTVADFLARACHVYPDRVAFVDEPDQVLGEIERFYEPFLRRRAA